MPEPIYLKDSGGNYLLTSDGDYITVGSYETYAVKYWFEFVSQRGQEWRIDIKQRGYVGDSVKGRQGAAPAYSVRRNGRIFGTSLSLTLEAETEGMYMDIAASEYKEFMVEVYQVPSGRRFWKGFIIPEEYSTQERAAPYDIAFTASDCIADLKDYKFEPCGRRTILNHLLSLLAPTGQEGVDMEILLTSALKSNLDNNPDNFAENRIDIDHLADKSYYDVLQSLLETFNATIQFSGSRFHVIRDIDIDAQDGSFREEVAGRGVGTDIIPPVFGSMNHRQIWPIGVLTSTMEPPRKSVTVTAPNEYIEVKDKILLSGTVSDGVATLAPGATLSFVFRTDMPAPHPIEGDYSFSHLLNIGAIATVPPSYGAPDTEYTTQMKVLISATDHAGNGYRNQILMEDVVGAYGIWRPHVPGVDQSTSVTLTKKEESPSGYTFDVYGFPVPSLSNSGAPWQNYVGNCNIKVEITNSGDRPVLVDYDNINVAVMYQSEGNEVTMNMNNLARRDAEWTEILVPDLIPTGQQRYLHGVLTNPAATAMAATFSSRRASASGLLTLIATELALEHYFARRRLEGKLQIDEVLERFPLFLREGATGILYRIESMTYDLLLDEMDVSMLSLVAAGTTDIGTERSGLTSRSEYRIRKLEEKMRQMGILYGIY